MKRLCICSSGGTGFALLASLAMGSWAYGQCANEVGGGDQAEGEACLTDNADDTVNGGCNSTPPVFVTLDTADFTNGAVAICGVGSNYLTDLSCPIGDECPEGDTCVDGTCEGPSQPSRGARDTDWYLVTNAALTANDLDGSGVVYLNSTFLGSELDLVTFLIGVTDPSGTCDTFSAGGDTGCIALGGQTCTTDDDCPSGNCVAGTCAADNVTGQGLLIIDDYPDGVVVFASPGECDGDPIYEGGFTCASGDNDYTLNVWFSEAPTACQPGPPQGPCNEAQGVGVTGCEDPACCALVCGILPFCCQVVWNQSCATAAIDRGCAPEPGGPVNMATGDDNTVDGYLRVKSDPYGSYADASFGGTPQGGDEFKPLAPLNASIGAFSAGYYIFLRDTNQRELLSNNVDWQDNYDFSLDDSLDREITQINLETDTDADGVTDQLNSSFNVTGAGVDLSVALQQNVDWKEPGVSTMTQQLVITNNSASPITFELLRVLDSDLLWVGTASDDSVGTGTNGNTAADTYVYIQEVGDTTTCVTMSSPSADAYAGSKQGVNPDINDPDCVEYGYGSDVQQWEAYGLPDCFVNNIAYVGDNTDGDSGNPNPAGEDAGTNLRMVVTIPAGPAAAVPITVTHTYGLPCPYGQCDSVPCPWDCETIPSGDVGVTDFLAILAQWGQVGTSCDFDGGGVGVTDFLELLAEWGPCP